MKLPKSKSIDVIFVHPKHRSYVVWHKGQFYQLTRMALTRTAWERRVDYTGSLEEIFLAKESCLSDDGVNDGVLQAIGLNIVKLPSELHSITASKFLAWWTVNRYSFWHALVNEQTHEHDVITAPTTDAGTSATESIQSVQPSLTSSQTVPTVETSVSTPSQASETNQKIADAIVMDMPATATKPQSASNHPPLEELSGDDIFDALFDDLIDEVSHAKQ